MKTILGSFLAIISLTISLDGCKRGGGEKTGAKEESDSSRVVRLTQEWSSANDQANVAKLDSMAGDSLVFYGKKVARETYSSSKKFAFDKAPDFSQKIRGGIVVKAISPNRFRTEFEKEVVVNGKSIVYPSYLEFEKAGSEWRLVVEGDLETDKNLSAHDGPKSIGEECKGDFNGDGKTETATLMVPKVLEEEMDCEGECSCSIVFSDPSIPAISLPMCIGGAPVNEGNLDGKGGDELGILPEWFTSCWRGYFVYSLKNGKWTEPWGAISTHCMQWEEGVEPIEPDPDRPGHVLIHSTILDEEDGDFKIVTEKR